MTIRQLNQKLFRFSNKGIWLVLTHKETGEKVFEGTAKDCAYYLTRNTNTSGRPRSLVTWLTTIRDCKNKSILGFKVWNVETFRRIK